MDFSPQIDTKISDYQEYLAKKTEQAKTFGSELGEVVEKLFTGDSDLVAIVWTQYIPTFNDGDPCEFSLGEVTLAYPQDYESKLKEFLWEDEDVIIDGDVCCTYTISYKLENHPLVDVASLLVDNEDICEFVFGTNVKVIVKPNGEIHVDAYYCGY